jgi:hypothetical protein
MTSIYVGTRNSNTMHDVRLIFPSGGTYRIVGEDEQSWVYKAKGNQDEEILTELGGTIGEQIRMLARYEGLDWPGDIKLVDLHEWYYSDMWESLRAFVSVGTHNKMRAHWASS